MYCSGSLPYRSRVLGALAVTLLSLLWALPATSATVRQLGVADLVRDSQMIFHGQVVRKRAIAGERKGQIFTRVTFRVLEVVQGPAVGTLELDFLGGTLNGRTLAISDMTVPGVGDEGVYFVEQLNHRQVNPLYGWWQGHFVVEKDAAGRKIMKTHALQPVYGLQAASSTDSHAISEGHAVGVTIQGVAAKRSPMTVDQFKSSVRRMAETLQ